MRPMWAVVLALAAAPLSGCLPTRADKSVQAVEALCPVTGGAEDIVQLDVVVLERPAGDHYINHGVWELADEQGNEDRKSLLEDNGFRVAQIGGMLPDGLQRLLEAGRGCADPRKIVVRAGATRELLVGPLQPGCRYRLHRDGREVPVEFARAKLTLQVVPTLTADGQTQLHFIPVVRHGGERVEPRVVQEPSGEHHWELEAREPREVYDWLAWDMTGAPNEYVLLGTRLDRTDTLGNRCFLQIGSAGIPTQRFLVLRTWRSTPAATSDTDAPRRAVPLALQASWSSARGCKP